MITESDMHTVTATEVSLCVFMTCVWCQVSDMRHIHRGNSCGEHPVMGRAAPHTCDCPARLFVNIISAGSCRLGPLDRDGKMCWPHALTNLLFRERYNNAVVSIAFDLWIRISSCRYFCILYSDNFCNIVYASKQKLAKCWDVKTLPLNQT